MPAPNLIQAYGPHGTDTLTPWFSWGRHSVAELIGIATARLLRKVRVFLPDRSVAIRIPLRLVIVTIAPRSLEIALGNRAVEIALPRRLATVTVASRSLTIAVGGRSIEIGLPLRIASVTLASRSLTIEIASRSIELALPSRSLRLREEDC